VTPWLLPGSPLEILAGPGGLAQPIPNGLRLRPALPPAPADQIPGRVASRTAELKGLTIGEAVCDLVLEVEATGVTLDVYHRSGGTGVLIVDLPMPPGAQVFVDYVDWDRQDVKGLPLELTIEPREDEYTIFRRYKLARREVPAFPEPGTLPAGIARFGLTLQLAEGADEDASRALATACARLLERPVRVALAGDREEGQPVRGTVVEMPAGEPGVQQRAWLASALEHHLLGAR